MSLFCAFIKLPYLGQGHLSCVKYGGDRGYNRRHNLAYYEDPVKNDIQLLSYYINKFRQEKNLQAREPTSTKGTRLFSLSFFLQRQHSFKNLMRLKNPLTIYWCFPGKVFCRLYVAVTENIHCNFLNRHSSCTLFQTSEYR